MRPACMNNRTEPNEMFPLKEGSHQLLITTAEELLGNSWQVKVCQQFTAYSKETAKTETNIDKSFFDWLSTGCLKLINHVLLKVETRATESREHDGSLQKCVWFSIQLDSSWSYLHIFKNEVSECGWVWMIHHTWCKIGKGVRMFLSTRDILGRQVPNTSLTKDMLYNRPGN